MFWINLFIGIIGILLTVIPLLNHFDKQSLSKHIWAVTLCFILLVLLVLKGCDDLKKDNQSDVDSGTIKSLKEKQDKMIGDRLVDSGNAKKFYDTLKANFSIIKDSITNKPIFIGKSFSNVLQQNKNGDNYSNSGINKGIMGPGGTMILGEKTLHPNGKTVSDIVKYDPSKNSDVYIKYESTRGAKNRDYAIELKKLLIKAGFKKVSIDDSMYSYGQTEKRLGISKPNDTIIIFVDMYK